MTDATAEQAGSDGKKGGKLGLLLGLGLGLAGAGAGFVLTSGGLPGGGGAHATKHEEPGHGLDTAFVPVPPLTVSLGRDSSGVRHLRFHAQLEVTPVGKEQVTSLLPRVSDVLNGYLRAIDLTDIENPSALVRIRAQMLRRVQIVVGEGIVKDLLVMEFVLN